jgi:hypothetical protein
MIRKVIQITATDSPNVKLALDQIGLGQKPTNNVVVPGVLDYPEYLRRLAIWDEVRICVGLRGQFYEGVDLLLFPPAWLDYSEELARELSLHSDRRTARALGIDPAEGGDSTVYTVIDEYGIIEQISEKTPNTADIFDQTEKLMRRYGLDPGNVCFDRGGGGKQHADYLRMKGYPVRTIAFGEKVTLPLKMAKTLIDEKREQREDTTAYLDRRAEMYGELSLLCNPDLETRRGSTKVAALLKGFAIPGKYYELRRQLALIPKWYDEKDRLYLPPKNRRGEDRMNPFKEREMTKPTLTQIIGHSPDEADSLAVAVHAMLHRAAKATAGLR